MNEKIVVIKSNKESNLTKAIVTYMESEKINYVIEENILKLSSDIKKIIYLDEESSDYTDLLKNKNIPIIMVSNKRNIMNDCLNINYMVTNLIDDKTKYTDVQNEYLIKKGIYHIFLEKLGELIENTENYNGIIYDLTELKPIPSNWIFGFDSINDTYNWLSKKNKMLPNEFIRKVVNFYNDKVYDDSLREINYLTEKLMEIKQGKNIIDVFICNKDELKLFRKNYFFNLLIKNISTKYKFYLIDKDKMFLQDKDIATKLLDGVAIYNDCVYKDTYNDEFSLGYVDCNESTIKEYNKYFDYVLNKYGFEIKVESDLNEF